MCIICVELEKNKLTVQEAWRNLGEVQNSMDKEHVEEVVDLIWSKLHSRTSDIEDKELDLWSQMFNLEF